MSDAGSESMVLIDESMLDDSEHQAKDTNENTEKNTADVIQKEEVISQNEINELMTVFVNDFQLFFSE